MLLIGKSLLLGRLSYLGGTCEKKEKHERTEKHKEGKVREDRSAGKEKEEWGNTAGVWVVWTAA